MAAEFFKNDDCEICPSGLIISLKKANSILRERGIVVYFSVSSAGDYIGVDRHKTSLDTHKALLIDVESLDSADKILADLAAFGLGGDMEERCGHTLSSLGDRAKKLREGK